MHELIHNLCLDCKTRMDALFPQKKLTEAQRKRRDEHTLEFFVGAMQGLKHSGTSQDLSFFTMIISIRGYSEVLARLAQPSSSEG